MPATPGPSRPAATDVALDLAFLLPSQIRGRHGVLGKQVRASDDEVEAVGLCRPGRPGLTGP